MVVDVRRPIHLPNSLGNDRVFMKFDQTETAPDAPNKGQPGFDELSGAVKQLQAAGFGLGVKGAGPGRFYDFDEVKKTLRTTPTSTRSCRTPTTAGDDVGVRPGLG